MKKIILFLCFLCLKSSLHAYLQSAVSALRKQIQRGKRPLHLSGFDFRGIGSLLKNSNLKLNFAKANMIGVLFSPCKKSSKSNYIRGYVYSEEPANLSGYNFSGANLMSSSFVNANLQSAILDDANIDGADFSGANLTNASMKNVNMNNAVFYKAKLPNGSTCFYKIGVDGDDDLL